MTTEICTASLADRDVVVQTLSDAFWDDPFLVYFYPDEHVRARKISRFFDLMWQINYPLGHVLVGSNGACAALWRPPEKWQVSRITMLANLFPMLRAYGGAGLRVARVLHAMERHHPRRPHWYLMTIGTAPSRQGNGFAGRAIMAGLERCDIEGLPSYLEAATKAHIPFYASFGFVLQGEISIANAPSFYPMWREPVSFFKLKFAVSSKDVKR